jgi:hypothetical protein
MAQIRKVSKWTANLLGFIDAVASVTKVVRDVIPTEGSKIGREWYRFIESLGRYEHAVDAAKGKLDELERCEAGDDVQIDAVEDSYQTRKNQELRVGPNGVLRNDVGWKCGEALTAALFNSPKNGSLVLNGDGSFAYVPDPGYAGADSFTYEVIALDGRSDLATVTILVIDCGAPRPDPCQDPAGYQRWLAECCTKTGADDCKGTADCGSRDPNDMTGPYGVGERKWVTRTGTMEYMIRFENDPKEASAPAAVVRVTQQLNPGLDWTTFRLGTIGFGDTVISGAVGKTSYRNRLDLRDKFGIYLDVSAGLDLDTGEAFWELRSMDPETGEVPFSPFVGFLPPNKNGSEGQGFLTYSIKPKRGVTTGTRIDAAAAIIFDQNEAIKTNEIFNTLDAGTPSSSVEALSAEVYSYPGLLVRWSGEDDEGGSGVARYDVYVSKNGGAFEPWMIGTTLTEARFENAEPGQRYAFYSVATDAVGHIETAPTVADTETLVVEPPSVEVVRVDVKNTTTAVITVEFSKPMDIQPMIDDGSIVDAVGLVGFLDGAVTLEASQFAYADATQTLSLTFDHALSPAYYELRLDGNVLAGRDGEVLRGGQSGLVFQFPAFDAAQIVAPMEPPSK